MVDTTRWRLGVGAMITVAILAAAACGKDAGTVASPPTAGGTGQLGTAPPATETTPPAGATTATRPATAAANPLDSGYPTKVGDYAVAFMRAVSARNTDRIYALGEDAAAQMSTEGYGKLATGWAMYSCSSVQADGTVGCTVRNDDGDDARVTLRNDRLGKPSAVTNVLMDLTTYPSDPGAYVEQLVAARGNQNKQRVAKLSNSAMFDKLNCQMTETSHAVAVVPLSTDANYKDVTYFDGGGVVRYPRYHFKVLASPGGKPNAVKDLLVKTCS